MHFQAEAIFTT